MKRLTAYQARDLMNEELSQKEVERIMDEIYYQIEQAARIGWMSTFTDQARYTQIKNILIEDGYTVTHNSTANVSDFKYTISWGEN